MPRSMPRCLRLTKRCSRQVETLLAGLPRTMPDIDIAADNSGSIGVEWTESRECFVPLRVGAKGWHAYYDGRSGNLEEASIQHVSRRVKAMGIWTFEVYEMGGKPEGNSVPIIWSEPSYYHLATDHSYSVSQFGTGPRFPRQLRLSNSIRQVDDDTFSGPPEVRAVGLQYATVSVDLAAHKCVRAMTVEFLPEDPDDPPVSHDPMWLDDAYINSEGRTVLLRRYHSQRHHNSLARWRIRPSGGEDDWPIGRQRLRYNDIDYYRWFDVITDATI